MAVASLYADGDEVEAIRLAAKEHRITVSVGISEKARYSSATLWNSNLIISPDGEVLAHHRKLMPTFYEKLVWSPGDGYGLKVVDIPANSQLSDLEVQANNSAKLGMLICGENTNPLARYALMAQGEQIHITTWPAKAPMRAIARGQGNDSPADAGNLQVNGTPNDAVKKPAVLGTYDNLAANRTRAAEHCFESKCYGVICSGFMTPEMISELVSGAPSHAKEIVASTFELLSQAESLFLDPSGSVLPGFVIDEHGNHQAADSAIRGGYYLCRHGHCRHY